MKDTQISIVILRRLRMVPIRGALPVFLFSLGGEVGAEGKWQSNNQIIKSNQQQRQKNSLCMRQPRLVNVYVWNVGPRGEHAGHTGRHDCIIHSEYCNAHSYSSWGEAVGVGD